jgi:uncharacterized protein YozE (UPF0346 family)
MRLKNIKDPSIAKEIYEQAKFVKHKLSYKKWVEYIDAHQDYFTWEDDTPDGIYRKNNIDKIPEWAREGILNSCKSKALAEFNKRKGWHEIILAFHGDFGIITTTFQKAITKEHLKILLSLANYLDALLLNHKNEIIDEKVIEGLENKKSMSREELIELGYRIKTCKDVEKLAVMIDLFNENVPHPDGARLFNYPENYEKHRGGYLTYNPTVEEVVDKALSYKEGEELQ